MTKIFCDLCCEEIKPSTMVTIVTLKGVTHCKREICPECLEKFIEFLEKKEC